MLGVKTEVTDRSALRELAEQLRDKLGDESVVLVGSADEGKVQLGEIGETFKTYFSGQGNMPGPPSGFFAGYAFSG